MKKWSVVILLFIVSGYLNAQLIRDDATRVLFEQGYDQLYQFRFQDAQRTIEQLKKIEKEGNWGSLLEINYHYLMMVTGDRTQNHKRKIFDLCEQLSLKTSSKNDLENLFGYYTALFFKERVYIHNKNYFSASKSIQFYKTLVDSVSGYEKRYPGFYLVNGLSELSLYAAGEKLPIGNWFPIFSEVDKRKGIELLNNGLRVNSRLMVNESYYFLFKYYLDVEKDLIKAYSYASKLLELYPENSKYLYYKALIVEKLGIKTADHLMKKYQTQIAHNNQLSSSQKKYMMHNPNIRISL